MIHSSILQNPAGREEYLKLLRVISSLSGLFSESDIPFLYYRTAENAFCRSFGADNLSRSDTAFDARIGSLGIGLKTFTAPRGHSMEKVAEFNSLSDTLSRLDGKPLAQTLALYRNERIQLARDIYHIDQSIYHIVARTRGALLLFETDYDCIDLDHIHSVSSSKAGIQFHDGRHAYSFNRSKSTLFRRFDVPSDALHLPIEILSDPYEWLLSIYEEQMAHTLSKAQPYTLGETSIVLPLYSTRGGSKNVPERSGLNQWNAQGRARDAGEMYIPVPREIHKLCPHFFPDRDISFTLQTPSAESFSASLCQDGAKALMTNPNKALSDWLLRKVFRLQERELLTYERMRLLDMDCVYIYKEGEGQYRIDKAPLGAYEDFIAQLKESPQPPCKRLRR